MAPKDADHVGKVGGIGQMAGVKKAQHEPYRKNRVNKVCQSNKKDNQLIVFVESPNGG